MKQTRFEYVPPHEHPAARAVQPEPIEPVLIDGHHRFAALRKYRQGERVYRSVPRRPAWVRGFFAMVLAQLLGRA